MILLSCLAGGIVYHVLIGDPIRIVGAVRRWRACQPYLHLAHERQRLLRTTRKRERAVGGA
jgi:hypothetical protein